MPNNFKQGETTQEMKCAAELWEGLFKKKRVKPNRLQQKGRDNQEDKLPCLAEYSDIEEPTVISYQNSVKSLREFSTCYEHRVPLKINSFLLSNG